MNPDQRTSIINLARRRTLAPRPVAAEAKGKQDHQTGHVRAMQHPTLSIT
jgi:hypothetical protein